MNEAGLDWTLTAVRNVLEDYDGSVNREELRNHVLADLDQEFHERPSSPLEPFDVRDLAKTILAETSRAFPGVDQRIMQTMCVAEEAGEFLAASRRYLGMARRGGGPEAMRSELADVVISAHTAALALGVNLTAEMARKAEVILTRGWRTGSPASAPVPTPVPGTQDLEGT